MFQRQLLTFAVVALVTAAGVLPGRGGAASGDINGDQCVDILDVQSIIAAVVKHVPADSVTDVNADGCVDVLDLQFILARATYARSPEKPTPPEPKPSATAPVRAHAPVSPSLARQLTLEPAQQPTPTCFRWSHMVHFVATPTDTERYLFTLTPHAPPTCA